MECEYRLLDENGRPADARVHLTPLLADVPHLDPGDPRAVRLPLGSALTCDGWEAEAVTPPLPWGPEVARELTDCVAATRAELLTILSVGTPSAGVAAVEGFSTHLNVTVPDRRSVTIARDLAHRCSVAMALLSEGPAGDGLLIRPRRGRLEVGCDHLEDRMLGPAVVLLVGVVGLLQHRRSRLPRLDVTVRPAREKFGHYIARDAAGADVVTSGRAMVLRTRRGTRLSGQDHLEQVWTAARPYAEAHGLAVGGTDALVAGSTPLPCEANTPGRWTTAEAPSDGPRTPMGRRPLSRGRGGGNGDGRLGDVGHHGVALRVGGRAGSVRRGPAVAARGVRRRARCGTARRPAPRAWCRRR